MTNHMLHLMKKASIRLIIAKMFRSSSITQKIVDCEHILQRDFST